MIHRLEDINPLYLRRAGGAGAGKEVRREDRLDRGY